MPSKTDKKPVRDAKAEYDLSFVREKGGVTLRKCRKCGAWKPVSTGFWRAKGNPSGLQTQCRDCNSSYSKRQREELRLGGFAE
jgi:hypothetical protein